VVQSLLPVEYARINNDFIGGINRSLRDIARDCGAEYLDVFSAFTDPGGGRQAGPVVR
jgi:hypothetical protein